MAENKDLKLIVGNDADVILMGDKERIMQIGDNLLSNAIKYTQAGNVSFRSGYDGDAYSYRRGYGQRYECGRTAAGVRCI